LKIWIFGKLTNCLPVKPPIGIECTKVKPKGHPLGGKGKYTIIQARDEKQT
jgi:hypothetical protein